MIVRARGDYIHVAVHSLSIYVPSLPKNEEVSVEGIFKVKRVGYDEVEVYPLDDLIAQSGCSFYYYSRNGHKSEFRVSVFAGRFVTAYYLDYGQLLAAFAKKADMVVAFRSSVIRVKADEVEKINELGLRVDGGGLPVINKSVCHSTLGGERPVCLTCIRGFRWAIVGDEVVGHYITRTNTIAEISKYI